MRFTKMHGAGNDYIYVDCFSESAPSDPAGLSQKISDRHFGIGGDGLVLIVPPESGEHDAKMRMFNADGSEAEMCGNAIRCVAKYLYDHRIAPKERLTIETGRGPLTLELEIEKGKMQRATVNMRQPILKSAEIPTTLPGDPPLNAPVQIGGRSFQVTCVSMGNPHAITYVDEPTDDWVHGIGPQVEVSPLFPRRINAEFVQVLGPAEIRMRVWERGSGETLACGTGACAVAVAGVLTGRTERRIVAHLPGGDLELVWSEADNCVYMTGPATEVFSGEWRN
ncbi:MAG: diaminopimelate epimerase [Planctomycetota bacterium]